MSSDIPQRDLKRKLIYGELNEKLLARFREETIYEKIEKFLKGAEKNRRRI